MFIPTTPREVRQLGWTGLDVILISGDAYIDSPFIGVAVIGKVLMQAGYRVGIIAQPDITSPDDIRRLGEPELFWGVTGGCIDSMVANYTATGRKRKSDDYTPGGVNDRRPDRAAIIYSNLIRQHCKGGRPIVLGGIEASLRRVAHYDYWSNKIRRSILFDAKADYLLYGMAERSVVELADWLRDTQGENNSTPSGSEGLGGTDNPGFVTYTSPGAIEKLDPSGVRDEGAMLPRVREYASPGAIKIRPLRGRGDAEEGLQERGNEEAGLRDQGNAGEELQERENDGAELRGRGNGETKPSEIRGLCYIANEVPEGYLELPSYQECAEDKDAFTRMFLAFYRNNDPVSAVGLAQRQDTRYLVQNPPARYLTGADLDAVHALQYEREAHPLDRERGEVKALETIRFSIATHQGCYGECHFCAIAVHQGRRVRWRSEESILAEARAIAAHPRFKGTLHDVGGPTANMYGIECEVKAKHGGCPKRKCLVPTVCPKLDPSHGKQIHLLAALRRVPGIKKVFVASGIRYDMILADQKHGKEYLRQLVRHHVGGQMKIAPEHSEESVLKRMGKPGREALLKFKAMFERVREEEGRQEYLTYYFIAAHPGCTAENMKALKGFAQRELHLNPEQVQVFTPTPSTISSLIYWTERDPFTGEPVYVEKSVAGKARQKEILTAEMPPAPWRRGEGRGGPERGGRPGTKPNPKAAHREGKPAAPRPGKPAAARPGKPHFGKSARKSGRS